MEINGGVLNAAGVQANGSPIFPGAYFTGPLLAGNIVHGDGSGVLAAVGETQLGVANSGYANMVQTSAGVTQGTAIQYGGNPIVLPAQSQITDIYMMVTTIGTGTFGVQFSTGTAITGAAVGSWTALGQLSTTLLPSTGPTIALWDNVGNTDVQVGIVSSANGAGIGTLSVFYVQGINNAS
jgi:hypothetical protein